MALDDLIRGGVSTVYGILSDGNLLPKVSHASWDGSTRDGNGNPTLGSPTLRPALVEDVDVLVKDVNGTDVRATTRILFLQNVTIRNEDRLLTPDGRTGPILRVDRGVLSRQGTPFLVQVYL